MSKLVEYRERMAAALKELSDLQQKDERSTDDESRIDALIAEANDLGPKIEREMQADALAKRSGEYTESAGRQVPNGGQPKPGAEPKPETRDMRGLGRRFAESEALTTWTGHGRSQPFDVRTFYPEHRTTEVIENTGSMTPDEKRALVWSGLMPADYLRPQLVPGIFRPTDLQGGSVRDVLINGTTTSDAITYMSETAFTNTATGVYEAQATLTAADPNTPLEIKPESALTFTQVTAPVVTIAHWIPITRQAIQDSAQLQTYVEQRLLDGLRLAESNQLLNGAGAPNLTGILQTANVQALNAAYFLANPVNNAGTDVENFNRILRARSMVRTTGRGRATFAIVNPADMEVFLAASDSTGNYMGTGPFQASPNVPGLWGLRVVEDENIAAGTVLVGDGTAAAVWDRMQSQIFIDTINDQFIRNMFTILAEERLALTVFRPTAFAAVTLA